MLPKIDTPTYDVKLPSSGKEVTIRPFLVKEEKLLLMAVRSNDAQEIIRTTKQVINNCLIDSDVNVDTLPFFDIDYLFIALRAKSIGEKIEVGFICQNMTEGNKCGGKFKSEIDISNVEVVNNDKSKLEIKFNDNLIFKMKYPTYAVMRTINENDDAIETKIKVISASIDKIFSNGQYYTNKDFTPEELRDFLENLTQQQFEKLDEFISEFPTFYATGKGKCLRCGTEHTVRYKDFVNFFR
jgi:T4 bacteriophage base plate protein